MNEMLFLPKSKYKYSPLVKFWDLDKHDIPASGGVYILLSRTGVKFTYPSGQSTIFYIGMSQNLKARLTEHHKYSLQAKKEKGKPLYWPRYEYAAKFGDYYTYIKTWKGKNPKDLEDEVLALFAKKFRSFPVANGSGAWNRVYSLFSS